MERLLVLVAVVCLTGCTQSSTASLAPQSPSPSPAALYAVMVHRAGLGGPYIVQLVSPSGIGGRWVSPMSRSLKTYYLPPAMCPPGSGLKCAEAEPAAYNLPEVSISKTRVYFLDGETQVKSLSPDGTVQTVMNISAPANSQVVFAVSPDDKRIAITVITLATSQIPDSFQNVMYVEDVGTGSNRVDIYSSTTLAQWPVAWHGRRVVVAVGTTAQFIPTHITIFENPYGATGYRIVQDASGLEVASLDCATGLLVPAGTACVTWCEGWVFCPNGTLGRQGWDASKTLFGIPTNPMPRVFRGWSYGAHLSPDGSRIAATNAIDQEGTAETRLFGNGTTSSLTLLGWPMGWLDNSHVIVSSALSAWIVDADHGEEPINMTGLQFRPVPGESALAGVLPTNLDSLQSP